MLIVKRAKKEHHLQGLGVRESADHGISELIRGKEEKKVAELCKEITIGENRFDIMTL